MPFLTTSGKTSIIQPDESPGPGAYNHLTQFISSIEANSLGRVVKGPITSISINTLGFDASSKRFTNKPTNTVVGKIYD